MYRTNANPPVERLHTKIIRPSKGAYSVPLLFAGAVILAAAFIAMIAAGDPIASPALDAAVAFVVLVLSGLGLALARRRRRALWIERVGDKHRLVIERDGITLEFPIRCHGTHATTSAGNLPIQQAYLQLVGANDRAVILRETRGSIRDAPRPGWPDDIDRNVVGESFDVSNPNDLAEVLEWVQRADADRE
jgi:hypothetical protein